MLRSSDRRAQRALSLALGLSLAGSAFAQAPLAPSKTAAPAPSPAAPLALPPLSESLSGQAKQDYDSARILYDDKDYAGALVKFKQSYQTSKDARLLWNAATCEKNLRHYARAMALVERYLASGAPYVTPEVQVDAHAFLDAVRPLTARVTVVCPVPDATVTLDGEPAGTTPLTEALVLDLGTHQFVVQRPGYTTFAKPIDVTGAGNLRVDAAIQKVVHEGHLVVRASAGDTISLDGRGVGSGTWEATIPSGGHTLRVTAPGKHAYQSEILVQDGASRTVSVTLDDKSKGVPTWVWVVGSGVLVAGAATGGYLLFKPADTTAASTPGTMQPGTVQLPFRR